MQAAMRTFPDLSVKIAAGDFPHAVQLLAAAQAGAQALGLKIEPELQKPYDEAVRAATARLPEAEFRTHWEAGRALSLEDAVQAARTTPE
jgi:hypothetical protein